MRTQLDGNVTMFSDDLDSTSFTCNQDDWHEASQTLSDSISCEDFYPQLSQTDLHLNESAMSHISDISDDLNDNHKNSSKIPVIIGHRPPPSRHDFSRPCSRFTIRRDNRAFAALSLPSIFVTNHRSLFPKFRNLLDEILEMNMQLGLHSEIWEKKKNIHHQRMIEEAFEIHGIKYISNPRKKRNGGGAAITLIERDFVLSKLDVSVPEELEVCWGLVKPKKPTPEFKSIIVCAFYSPPRSRTKSKLVEHIGVNFFKQKALHPNSFFVCGGDKNDLNTKLLLDISPTLHQIVTKPTYKNSILEIIVTDLGHLYHEPVIRPAVDPDDPNDGVPSDHSIALALPNVNPSKPAKRDTLIKLIRPFDIEHKNKFAEWIQHEDWSMLKQAKTATEMVDNYVTLTHAKLDEICLQKAKK